MFIQKMKSEGISHLSYMLGSESEAIVIDPRLDTEIYHELAQQNEFEIKVEEKDLVSLINIIKVFDNSKSGKIKE